MAKRKQTVGAKKLIDDRGGCRAIADALDWPYTTVHTFHRTNRAPKYRWQAIAALPVTRQRKALSDAGASAA